MMINTTGTLLYLWHLSLDGAISCPVYKEDAPENVYTNYVLLRAEGGRSMNNKHAFADETVVIVDIVTVFQNNVDRSVCEYIDNEICGIILPSTITSLPTQNNMQFLNVKRESFEYVYEDDGIRKYYRKVSRFSHYVHQK